MSLESHIKLLDDYEVLPCALFHKDIIHWAPDSTIYDSSNYS